MAAPTDARALLGRLELGAVLLLLLAAAATFLAMQWEALGATARIAVVGGLTAAAVLGGARLRRTLPVGLAFQLGAPSWVRWTAVGVTAIVALPLLALTGRAPLLGLASLAGVPVAATGLAMVGGPAPAVVVGAAGSYEARCRRCHEPDGAPPASEPWLFPSVEGNGEGGGP